MKHIYIYINMAVLVVLLLPSLFDFGYFGITLVACLRW